MRKRYREMDACFADSLEAHWKCTDEVKTSEAKRNACLDEVTRHEKSLSVRWARDGPGITEVKARNNEIEAVKLNEELEDEDED
jgi:hypothetical protein